VSSQGIEWQANDFDPTHIDPPLAPPPPTPNEITTGPGPARTGQYGIFDLEHGYAWGTSFQCDVDNPEPHCLYHDGFTIKREPGRSPLLGAGGFFTGIWGANVAIVLNEDYLNPIGGGQVFGGGHQFFGVIDAGPTGLTQLQFREVDGKIGQALFVFGDDFTVLAEPACAGLGGDTDGDGLCDGGPGGFCAGGANTFCMDNCKYVHNPSQADGGGIADQGPDGIGDACQCGDVTGDAVVNGTDATFIKREALDLFSPGFGNNCPNFTDSCEVDTKGNCL
jgi:hypothetical protein